MQLDGSGSSDPDNEIVSYDWDLDNDGLFGAEDNDCFGEPSDAVGVMPQWTWHTDYIGVVGLRVCDAAYNSFPATCDTDFTTVTIGNHDPVANADGPYPAAPGQTIILYGSGSFDPDLGDTLDYAWDMDNDGEFDDAFVVMPPFTAGMVTGVVHVVKLKVTDDSGAYDIDNSTVEVIPVPLTIDIYPNRTPNWIFLSRNYTLYVTVLGQIDFDVTTLDPATVTFGRTGVETSPVRPPMFRDLNRDGYLDAMYGFMTFDCGFVMGDVTGKLTAKTFLGEDAKGEDSVLVTN